MRTSDSEPQGGSHKHKKKTQKKGSNASWVLSIFLISIVLSSVFSLSSSLILEDAGLVEAFLVLLIIVLIGIAFDAVGVAVITASEKPFHSMAAKKVPGAVEALKLLRNAEKVSSLCNDVVGDICGIISGSASAVIAVQALQNLQRGALAQLIMSAVVAGLTIAGKALGKNIAMKNATKLVHMVSKPIYYIKSPFRRKQKRKKK